VHHFEGKPLVQEFISNTLMGIEYLWGDTVQLETSEVESITNPQSEEEGVEPQIKWQRVVYTMKDRKLSKTVLQ
jgi:stage V sporulation protein R